MNVDSKSDEPGLRDFTVIAVDADNVGAETELVGNSSILGFNSKRVRRAVASLQQDGLRVILVSRHDLSQSFQDPQNAPIVDSSRLLHVKAINPTPVDLVRVAEEYECCFLTLSDTSCLEDDWRLPRRRQTWLRSFRHDLHARFEWDRGTFRAIYPEKLGSFLLAQRLPSGSRIQAARTIDTVGGAPKSRCEEAVGGTTPVEYVDLSGATWRADAGEPPLAVLRARAPGSLCALCVLCDNDSDPIFQNACYLSSLVDCSHLRDEENGQDLEELMADLDELVAGPWAGNCDSYLTTRAEGGPSAGIWAIGLGGNKKGRKRAARLALAVADKAQFDRVLKLEAEQEVKSSFMVLVQRARKLIGDPKHPGATETWCWNQTGGRSAATGPPPSQGGAVPPTVAWLAAPAASTPAARLVGKVAKALSDHATDKGGYLGLKLGDLVTFLTPDVLPGEEDDPYETYVFCKLLDSSRWEDEESQGWLPLDLLEVCG